MEIELPDGTVLDAPDDADVKAVVTGYRRKKLATGNPGEYDPSSQAWKDKYGPLSKGRTEQIPVRGGGMTTQPQDDTFSEGVGSGMLRMTRGLGNLADKGLNKHPLIKAMGGMHLPGYEDKYSDEIIRQQDETDQPLADTGKGTAGQVLGQTAVAYGATAPIGALGAVSKGAGMLPRALGHGLTRAALEGGVTGAGAARVDEQGEGAVKGALLSGAINRIFAGGGRALKGLVKKNEATEALQQLAGQQGEEVFVPISQAAGDQDLITKGARIAYAEGLSLMPGVKGQLTRQSENAAEKVRELAIKEATPEGVHLPDRPGHQVQESLASIRQGFDEAYDDTVKSLDYRIPLDLRSQLYQKIKGSDPNIDAESVDKAMKLTRGLLRRFSNESDTIEGSGILTVRNELRKAAEKAPEYERKGYVAAGEVLDEMIKKRLQVQGLWQKFADLEEPARHMKGLEGAAHSARAAGGRFSPGQLARNAKDATQLDLGQTAGEALKGSPAGTSFAGRSLLGGVGTVAIGAAGGPVAAGTALVGANLLATKTAQKALMGDTAAQRAIIDLLKEHPEMSETIKKALQTAAATSTGE